MRTRIASLAAALSLATIGLVSSGVPVMAATTSTVLVSGNYLGTHAGGPFAIPAGKSLIEVDINITDAPPGANVVFEVDTSADGGATWQPRVQDGCPGGTAIPKGQTVAIDQSCSGQYGIFLDPGKTYLARYSEHSDVTIAANASITIF